jgi:plastocyanin
MLAPRSDFSEQEVGMSDIFSPRPWLAAAVFAILVNTFTACDSKSPTQASQSSGPDGTTLSADLTVAMLGIRGNQSYSPNPVTVRVGQRLAWRNGDSITHTATQDTAGFNTGNIAPGATSSPITMSTAGTFPYHCTLHPGMVGTITVQ